MNLRIGMLAALLIAALAHPAQANEVPPSIAAALRADSALKAVRIEGKIGDNAFVIECVRPHDFRLSARGLEMVRVGSSLYERFAGTTILAPAPPGIVKAFNERRGVAYLISSFCGAPVVVGDAAVFTDAGDGELDGKPVHRIRVAGDPSEKERVFSLGADDRCYGVEIVYADGSSVALRYSRFDDVPKITRPVNGS